MLPGPVFPVAPFCHKIVNVKFYPSTIRFWDSNSGRLDHQSDLTTIRAGLNHSGILKFIGLNFIKKLFWRECFLCRSLLCTKLSKFPSK